MNALVPAAMLLAIGCAAEPLAPSPCEEAVTTLERCTGQVPEGFREACDAAPDQVASSVLAEGDAEKCMELSKSDLGKEGFVDACTLGINAAYWVVWARSESSQPLPGEVRERLRPWFGDLVDTTRVSWSSGLLTQWRVLGHDVILEDDTLAQTFGHEIFVREAQTLDNQQLALIGHELGHAAQYRKYGGVIGFARQYCSAFYDAKFSYRNNPLEEEAYDLQQHIEACLDYGIDCP